MAAPGRRLRLLGCKTGVPPYIFKRLSASLQTARCLQRGENKVLGRLWAYNLYVLCQRLHGNKYSAAIGIGGRIYVFLNMFFVIVVVGGDAHNMGEILHRSGENAAPFQCFCIFRPPGACYVQNDENIGKVHSWNSTQKIHSSLVHRAYKIRARRRMCLS